MEKTEFVRGLRTNTEVADRASIDWKLDDDGISIVSVSSSENDRLRFSVAWSEHEIVIGLNDTARVELGPIDEDGELALGIVDAIIAGRVVQRRRAFVITLANGQKIVEHLPSPQPGQLLCSRACPR